jgi:hypothetical protein
MATLFRTASGIMVDYEDPQPETIIIEDIAHHLSLINRFTGGTSEAYSVAAHSIWVCNHCSHENALAGLLHDATEAYISDVSKPLKSLLPSYRVIEDGLWRVISEKFGVDYDLPEEVHALDHEAYEVESWTLQETALHGLGSPGRSIESYRNRSADLMEWWFLRRFRKLSGES